MTDTTEIAAAEPASSGSEKDARADLAALRLPQLQAIAAQLGISGTARMRKSDLLEAIKTHQGGGQAAAPARRSSRRAAAPAGPPPQQAQGDEQPVPPTQSALPVEIAPEEANGGRRPRRATRPAAGRVAPADQAASPDAVETAPTQGAPRDQSDTGEPQARGQESRGAEARGADARGGARRQGVPAGESSGQPVAASAGDAEAEPARDGEGQRRFRDRRDGRDGRPVGRETRESRDTRDNRDARDNRDTRDNRDNRADHGDDDEDGDGRRGRRRGRYRDRKRRGRGENGGSTVTDEPEVGEDDVLVPVAGILDVLDNYAFLRTSGYLPGSGDVYVSLGQVKRYGLRKGDAVVGAVRQQREGEPQRQKFNALVRVDSVNATAPEEARNRPEFGKLTPLYPQERLRLETEPNILTTRIIDLVAPIGKGQRALIVSPSKAGKTLVMQAIANAITRNNPECHLMVVLVDERPEEVTDMQRAVKGEVIASTFDRPADDHTTVAELAIERAKRLVELGHDVVVLLDSITRLGRAYNLAAPASGRILSGGVDSSALYPPKRFFGAARNIEHGGSLTIIATALIETGSKMDEVIFEEFKGTGNMELRLRRELADKRIFPAVDVNASGTRREEILMSKEELSIVWKLRRVMGALDTQQALELLLDRIKSTKSNAEFLLQVQKSTPTPGRDDDD